MSASLNHALDYHARGWMPIPIPHGSKNPNRKGWQKENWSCDDLPRCFNNGQGVGLLLGKPSGGLVDIDLDCAKALGIADAILPATNMVSGRDSAPSSHRWYICEPLLATVKFKDPSLADADARAMIVEFRSTGSQTIAPPSIHPSGEIYQWYGELSPIRIDGNALLKSVSKLAACALVARHWQNGQRHDTALALSGVLLRAGWLRARVERFISLVATAANDEELDDRVRTVETTEQRIIAGEKATGLPILTNLIGEKVVVALQKWLNLSVEASEAAPEENQTETSKVVCLADVEPEQVSFLWHPYIPQGKLTIIEGDPGVGKSWLTCALATATAAGSGPAGWANSDAGNILMLSVEDGLADTIRPRLDSMRANVKRIFALPGALVFDDAGLLQLEVAIIDYKPALVVIDPLVAYLGAKVDMHRANETRAVMARLAGIAERYGCAIVAVRHLTKGGTDKAIYRGIGSIDFLAACRSALLVGSDPDEPSRRAIVHNKCNIAEQGAAVGYEIRDGQFFWTGPSNLTAERILSSGSNEENRSAIRVAEDFLRDALAEGPRPSTEVQKEAREAGISEPTLNRAKHRLGIKAKKQGKPGDKNQKWVWDLPKTEDNHEDYQAQTGDNLRANSGNKEFDTADLAEDYQESGPDSLRSPVDNLRVNSEVVDCYGCGSSGIRFTHCNKCGEFLR
jgi:AAA domain/Bifunctional DNA primase/polymerase, N-terminal